MSVDYLFRGWGNRRELFGFKHTLHFTCPDSIPCWSLHYRRWRKLPKDGTCCVLIRRFFLNNKVFHVDNDTIKYCESSAIPCNFVINVPYLTYRPNYGRMNYKDTAFTLSLPVNRLPGILYKRFHRLEIHSHILGIFDPACELLPPWTKNYTCVQLPLYSTFSLTSSPLPPSQTKCTVYTDSVWLGWGKRGVELYLDHILQEFYILFLTRFRTYKIVSPPPNKNDQ